MLPLRFRGEIAQCEGQYELAERCYKECLTLWQELGDNGRSIGVEYFNLGQTTLLMGQTARGADYVAECLTLAQKLDDQSLIHCALEGLANVASAQQDPVRAAILWGAAESWREARGDHLAMPDQLAHEHFVAMVKQQADEWTFKAAWAEGRAMTQDEVMAYALQAAQDSVLAFRSDN